MATFTKLVSGNVRAMVRMKGHNKSKTFPTKALAKIWAAQTELAITQKSVGLMPVKHASLGELIAKYMSEVHVKAASSQKIYRRVMRDPIGRTKLRNLNYQHVDRWVETALKTAKPPSVCIYLSLLNKVMRWGIAVKRLDLPENVFRDAIQRMRFNGLNLSITKRTRTVSEDELQILYAWWAANPQTLPMREIVEFAIETCCRVGEICKVEAKDFQSNTKTLWLLNRKHPGKTEHNTELPLSDRGFDLVRQRLSEGFTVRLFPYSPRAVSEKFKAACHACNIEDLRFHDLRHTGATRYALKGLKMQELQLITGHTSILSLSRYVNLKPNDIHRRLAELDAERTQLMKIMAAE